MKKVLTLLLALCLLLCGCRTAAPEETEQAAAYDWMAGECPIPQQRTGIDRQGLTGIMHSFECTDTGTYFLADTPTGTWILYGDHGSDTLIKLCGRADCIHDSTDCDANANFGTNLCYYGGYLYYASQTRSFPKLMRMRPDGTEHEVILDTAKLQTEGYSGSSWMHIWNGVFSFMLTRLTEDGSTYGECYYYQLDGSMSEPERFDMGFSVKNDGDKFITMTVLHSEAGEYNLWDPETGTVAYLTELKGLGYYGAEQAYYFADGCLIRETYSDGKTEVLLETRLQGDYRVFCFPNCVMLGSCDVSDQTLYIYNWAMEPVDQVKLDFLNGISVSTAIVGETDQRVIFTDSWSMLPRYYIEKSELGTGNVKIHEYNLPDLTEELAMLDELLADEEWLNSN